LKYNEKYSGYAEKDKVERPINNVDPEAKWANRSPV
jgi:hypothetical protein